MSSPCIEVCKAKFGLLGEPIRVLLFVVDQFMAMCV